MDSSGRQTVPREFIGSVFVRPAASSAAVTTTTTIRIERNLEARPLGGAYTCSLSTSDTDIDTDMGTQHILQTQTEIKGEASEDESKQIEAASEFSSVV